MNTYTLFTTFCSLPQHYIMVELKEAANHAYRKSTSIRHFEQCDQ